MSYDALRGKNSVHVGLKVTIAGDQERCHLRGSPLDISLINLQCGQLWEQFERTGNIHDLNLCIEKIRELRSLLHSSTELYHSISHNLGLALTTRFERVLEGADLDEAIRCFDEAVKYGKHHGSVKVIWVNNLANALRLRAHRDSRISDLEVAMALHEDVVRHTPAGHPDYQAHLTNLANDQIDLYYYRLNLPSTRVDVSMQPKSALDINLLRRADNLLQGALDAGGGTHADLAKALAACAAVREGLALQHLAEHGRDDAAHAEQVIAAFRVAVGSGIECDPGTSMRIAVNWGRWAFARKSWEEAVEAFEHVLQLSHRLFRAQHDRYEREAWLREAQASGSMLAYALCELDRSQEAAAMLDGTLARILSLSLQEARGELRDSQDDSAEFMKRYFVVAEKAHPLVFMCYTVHGGVAVFVTGGGTSQKKLPALTEAFVESQLRYFNGTYRATPEDWRQAILSVTKKFWKHAMEDVIAELGTSTQAVLIPVGKLALIPFHASWHEDSASENGRVYACDKLLITYAPNAYFLCQRPLVAQANARLLVVEDTTLPGAHWEAASIALGFSHAQPMSGNQATRDAVIPLIERFDVIHFCCHARAEVRAPMQSSLVLPDGTRIDRDTVLNLRLQLGPMVILSACETGMPGQQLPDEVLSIASAFLEAGAKGVVSTDWAVDDTATSLLMIQFYYLWRHTKINPSYALRCAQQWLRDSSAAEMMCHIKAYQTSSISEEARAGLNKFLRARPPAERPFAHPYYWAAFRWSGVGGW